MRRSFLVAAVVASLGFAACSNGSSTIPGASSSFANARGGSEDRLVITGGLPQAQCPIKYIGCFTIAKGHPVEYTICVSKTYNCSSGSFPNEKWTSKIQTLKKKAVKGVTGKFKPNPGNPTHGTVTATVKLKDSKGKIVFVQTDKACPPKGGSSCTIGQIAFRTK